MSTQTIANDPFTYADQSGWPSPWTHPLGNGVLSIASNRGRVTGGNSANYLVYTGTNPSLSADVYVRAMATASSGFFGLIGRYQDNSNFVSAFVGNNSVVVNTLVGGGLTHVASTTSFTLSANTNYRMHLSIHGDFLGFNIWIDGNAEPAGWFLSGSLHQTLTGGTFGLYAYPFPGTSSVYFDGFSAIYATRDIYVSPSGSDSNAGDISNPVATLYQAALLAAAGDTIHALNGSYQLNNGTLLFNQHGTASQPILVKSEYKWQAKIVNVGNSVILQNNGHYMTLQDFDIGGDSSSYLGVDFNACNYCWAIGNYVHDIGKSDPTHGSGGMDCLLGTGINFIRNIVARVGSGGGTIGSNLVQGIYISSSYTNAINNLVFLCGGYGIQNYHRATNGQIINNTIFNCGFGAIVVAADSSNLADYMYVSNNICVYNGFHSGGSGGGGIIENDPVGTHNTYTNNCVYGNELTAFGDQIHLLHGNTAVNTVSADPQFLIINTNGSFTYQGITIYLYDGTGNYRLKSTSPCVGAGASTNAPNNDLDGNPRPFGTNWDIGCYEYLVAPLVGISLGGTDGIFSLSGRDGILSLSGNDGILTLNGRG